MYEFKTESDILAGNNIPGIHHGFITEMFKLSRKLLEKRGRIHLFRCLSGSAAFFVYQFEEMASLPPALQCRDWRAPRNTVKIHTENVSVPFFQEIMHGL